MISTALATIPMTSFIEKLALKSKIIIILIMKITRRLIKLTILTMKITRIKTRTITITKTKTKTITKTIKKNNKKTIKKQ